MFFMFYFDWNYGYCLCIIGNVECKGLIFVNLLKFNIYVDREKNMKIFIFLLFYLV